MVSPVSVLKNGFEFYSVMEGIFGSSTSLTDIKNQLTEIKTLTLQVLTGLDDARELAITTYISPIESLMNVALDSFFNYSNGGAEGYKKTAIDNSQSALSLIVTYLTNESLTGYEKTALAPILIAAIGLRLEVISEFEDGAIAAEYNSEIIGAKNALNNLLPDVYQTVEDHIVINFVSVEHVSIPYDLFNWGEWVTISFTTSSDPATTGPVTLRFYQEYNSHSPNFVDGLGGMFTDNAGFEVWDATSRDLGTIEFLSWLRAVGGQSYIDDYIQSTIDLDYSRSNGPEMEQLVIDLTELINGAWLKGDLNASNYDDYLTSDDSVAYTKPDTLDGYTGNDILVGGGGNDTLRGGADNDVLIGNAGDDIILGGTGDDWIEGGLGDDRIEGGTGTDTAAYTHATNGVSVSLSLSGRQLTLQGKDAIVGVENLYGSDYGDTLIGDGQVNHIRGRDGNDWIKGLNGNDTLEGGAGNDLIEGGAGTDTAVYTGSLNAYVNLTNSAAQYTGHGNDTLVSIENVTTGSGNDDLKGDAGNNRLISNAGNDYLTGGLGDDYLDGGADMDTAYFGDDLDTTVDLTVTTAQNTGHGNDTLLNIENITASGGNDTLKGNAQNNRIWAGSGNDTLEGGEGDDVLTGGDGIDTAVYTGSNAAYIDLRNLTAQYTGHGDDTLTGIENLTTGSGNDDLTGDDGNNRLIANAGNDTLTGGFGNDYLDGGTGVDTAYFSGDLDITVDLNITNAQATGHGNDTIRNIENVTTNGGNDNLIGNAQNNRFFGNAGKDTLNGGAGDDFLGGGDGVDTAEFLGSADVTVDLRILSAQNTGHGNDTLDAIENILSGSGADTLIGNDAKNLLTSGGGKDTLKGGKGNDTLKGGGGADKLLGGNGKDKLTGGKGDDVLTGGKGADKFIFANNAGSDTVNDFDALNNKEDINLSAVTAITGFNNLKNNYMVEDGDNVVIDDGAGTVITLLNVDLADLGKGDFIF